MFKDTTDRKESISDKSDSDEAKNNENHSEDIQKSNKRGRPKGSRDTKPRKKAGKFTVI